MTILLLMMTRSQRRTILSCLLTSLVLALSEINQQTRSAKVTKTVKRMKMREDLPGERGGGGGNEEVPDDDEEEEEENMIIAATIDNEDAVPAPLSPWNNKCKAKHDSWDELDDPSSSIHLVSVEQITRK